MKAIVLLSGGMDSTTVLGYVKSLNKFEKILCIYFDYGHKHNREYDNARQVVEFYDVGLLKLDFDFAKQFNSSTIIYAGEKHLSDDYMPFRNMIIFAVASGYAQAHGYQSIFYGANADDIFPDNLKPFLEQYNRTVQSMEADVKIEYPLIKLDKKGVVELANKLGVPLNLTRTCYEGNDKSCGKCVACKKRLEGFSNAGIGDPIEYD